MSTRPTIVCLCGSTRFKEAFEAATREETLAGKIVLSVGMFGHQEGLDMNGPVKEALDKLHREKIKVADEILVLDESVIVCNQCGKPSWLYTQLSNETACCRSKNWETRNYIGSSTAAEIVYAQYLKKNIRYRSREKS